MSVQVTRHFLSADHGMEIVDLIDSHGRKLQIQVNILSGLDPDEEIAARMAEFEAQEKQITEHIQKRFDPETLERKR